MEEAQYLCEQIVVIDQGKILARGTLEELLSSCDSHEIIEVTFKHTPPFDLSEINGVKKVSKEEDNLTFRLDVEHIVKTLPEILKRAEKENAEILSIQSRTMTLDDLFITMTGRHLVS
jgi:ABC-2 type transport system ATP-binding protein